MLQDKAPVAHAIGAFFVLAGVGGGAGHRARAAAAGDRLFGG
jgi:hypothetical protein